MKSRPLRKILTLLLICTFLFNMILSTGSNTKGAYGDISDQTFNYVLDNSAWSIQIDDLINGGIGGTFKDIKLPQRGLFSVEVLNVDIDWGVDFKVSNATNYALGYKTNDEFLLEFTKILYYPEEECIRLTTDGFDSSKIVGGPSIFDWFFIEPEADVWEFLDNLTTLEYHNSLPGFYSYEAILQAVFERENKQAIFDAHMKGSFENQSMNVQMQFDHNVKFVWNETTGIMLGYRISTSFSGTYQNYRILEEIDVSLYLSGYDLPRFSFVSAFIPGFEIGVTIISIVTLIIFNLFLNRIRKKKG